MRFFNKAMRRTTAIILFLLTLGIQAWAQFQSGFDVGKYCYSTSLTQPADPGSFGGCCNGGCGGFHSPGSSSSSGYSACMSKCLTCIDNPNCG